MSVEIINYLTFLTNKNQLHVEGQASIIHENQHIFSFMSVFFFCCFVDKLMDILDVIHYT